MTRSELIQFSIECSKVECLMCQTRDRCKDCSVALMRELLLAEQKRSDGCAYCQSGAFDKRLVGVYGEEGWNKYHIFLCGGGQAKEGEQFDFCPKCGKRLTEGESV